MTVSDRSFKMNVDVSDNENLSDVSDESKTSD